MSDFWARRKAAVAKEVAVEQASVEAAELAETEAKLAERPDEELLAEAKLPAPEELDSAEAVRDFLSSTLPQRLKTRALRQLWKLNPVLANLDGLVDYGEDFTDSATVIENLQTAYQVGKGMLAHLEEMARQEEAKAKAAEAPEHAERGDAELGDAEPGDQAPAETPPDEDDTPNGTEIDAAPAPAPILAAAGAPPDPQDADPAPLRARRMQFHFEEPA